MQFPLIVVVLQIIVVQFTGSLLISKAPIMRRSSMMMRSVVPDKGVLSAWQQARRSEIKMPCIILVNPYLDANIGSVSRCMLNWGLSELRIGSIHTFTPKFLIFFFRTMKFDSPVQ
jgi:hypothetical protein